MAKWTKEASEYFAIYSKSKKVFFVLDCVAATCAALALIDIVSPYVPRWFESAIAAFVIAFWSFVFKDVTYRWIRVNLEIEIENANAGKKNDDRD